MQGQHFQVDKEPLLAIPLCVPSRAEQEKIAKLVTRIIECIQLQQAAATDADSEQWARHYEQYETQLQDKIETLYGLSDDDRQMLGSDD